MQGRVPDTDGRRRHLVRVLLGAVMAGPGVAGAGAGADVKRLPAEQRQYVSPSARYRLAVAGPAGWSSPWAQAAFFVSEGAGQRQLWARTLAQRFGPGQVLVTDSGWVVMFDEGQKSPSEHAIELVGLDGQVAARYAVRDIARVSGVPLPEVIGRARFGAWMSAEPQLGPEQVSVVVEAGGVRLTLQLATGRLTRTAA